MIIDISHVSMVESQRRYWCLDVLKGLLYFFVHQI